MDGMAEKTYPISVKLTQIIFFAAIIVYALLAIFQVMTVLHLTASIVFGLGMIAMTMGVYCYKTGSWKIAILDFFLAIAIYVHCLFLLK